jgi:hypothetical protein
LARRPISQIRGRNKFRRRPGSREPRSITLIVCEGESEQAYFDAVRLQLKLLTTEVVIPRDQGGLAPISVVEYAEERAKERGGYDHIFCEFDRDQHESFNRARAKVRSLATRSKNPLAIVEVSSIPCFEVWVLLHFEQTDAPFGACQNVVHRVQSHLPGYQKADPETVKQLLPQLENAMTNAHWLSSRAGIADENPSTAVHRVIAHLSAISAQN